MSKSTKEEKSGLAGIEWIQGMAGAMPDTDDTESAETEAKKSQSNDVSAVLKEVKKELNKFKKLDSLDKNIAKTVAKIIDIKQISKMEKNFEKIIDTKHKKLLLQIELGHIERSEKLADLMDDNKKNFGPKEFMAFLKKEKGKINKSLKAIR